jgi:hypothetical protein
VTEKKRVEVQSSTSHRWPEKGRGKGEKATREKLARFKSLTSKLSRLAMPHSNSILDTSGLECELRTAELRVVKLSSVLGRDGYLTSLLREGGYEDLRGTSTEGQLYFIPLKLN